MLRDVVAIALGRLVRRAVLVLRPGGATAIPGRVVERLAPGLLARILRQPPRGLVIVSGSNGKSTTTKLLAAIVEAHGLDVFTNRFTANITRGMLSELLREVDWRGRFGREIAVMEVDEAYAALLAEQVEPRVTVLLNVMIDQLHRWGEPERVASYLARAAGRTSETVVINAEDSQLTRIASFIERGTRVSTVSVTEEVRAAARHGLGSVGEFSGEAAALPAAAHSSKVLSVDGVSAVLEVSGLGVQQLELPGRGIHLAIDAGAAIEGARAVLGERFEMATARRALAESSAVFGRGERTLVGGEPVDFVLAKSPGTFQANIDLLDPVPEQCLVAVGRDIVESSPLWMTDWRAIPRVSVVTGPRCWDMALKLDYDGVELGEVIEEMEQGLARFLALPPPETGVKTLILSAQAMRWVRRRLGLYTNETATRTEGAA